MPLNATYPILRRCSKKSSDGVATMHNSQINGSERYEFDITKEEHDAISGSLKKKLWLLVMFLLWTFLEMALFE